MIPYIIMGGVLAIAITVLLIFSKKRDAKKQAETETKQLTIAITATGQHLKYKTKITTKTIITVIAEILISLCLMLAICLPIFQIKLDILGETIVIKQFSFIDNANTLIDKSNESTRLFTDIDGEILNVINYLFIALSALLIPLRIVLPFVYCSEKAIQKTFIRTKQDKKNVLRANIFNIFLNIFIFAIPLIEFLLCKNAEYKFIDKASLTTEYIDNYIHYYSDGKLAFSVFQNDLKSCNGVSGYIAIPIICFILGLILSFAGQYLDIKIIKEIANEKIEGLDEQSTTENSGNQ